MTTYVNFTPLTKENTRSGYANKGVNVFNIYMCVCVCDNTTEAIAQVNGLTS